MKGAALSGIGAATVFLSRLWKKQHMLQKQLRLMIFVVALGTCTWRADEIPDDAASLLVRTSDTGVGMAQTL